MSYDKFKLADEFVDKYCILVESVADNHHMDGILMLRTLLIKPEHLGGGDQSDVLSLIFHILPGFQDKYLAFLQAEEMIYAHEWEGIWFTADFRNKRRND